MTNATGPVQGAQEESPNGSLIKTFACYCCHHLFAYSRNAGAGRNPCYCRPCVKAKERERIQLRNVQDRAKRLMKRDPLCRSCRNPLVYSTTAASGAACAYFVIHAAPSASGQDGRRNESRLELVRK